MGRQIGIIRLSGQFGDMQLSIQRSKGIAKLAVPVSKDRIKTADEYLNTRKVNVEFKAASLAVDTLKSCLCGKTATFGDQFWRARFQAALIDAVRRGSGDFGERSLEVRANCTLLKGMSPSKEARFKNWFLAPFTLLANPDRNTATLTVPAFLMNAGTMQVPVGATHFRVCVCIGVLGDLVYASSDARYRTANPQTNGLNAEASSTIMPVSGQNLGFQVVASLPGLPVLASTEGLVMSLAIEYFFVVNNNPVLKAMGNAMDIMDVL